MFEFKEFDVLIVYSAASAISASKQLADVNYPFSVTSNKSNYNDAYAYFLDYCEKQGLSAAFSTAADITGPGSCASYWMHKDKSWMQVAKPCFSKNIFDKLSPININARKYRKLLFSSDAVKPFNNEYLSKLFTDKAETYKKLSKFSIPTVFVDKKNIDSIKQKVDNLQKLSSQHKYAADFSNQIIAKDRYGAGGSHIYKIEHDFINEIHKIVNSNKKISFILQPFLNFQKGYSFEDVKNPTDLRLIYQNEKLIQTYIRIAKENDFRCNEHKGGKLIYVNKSDIPGNVVKLSEDIIFSLKQEKGLFALDFVVSDNGNPYFLEGNTGPGIDWNLKLKKNEQKSKELIRFIVKEFVERANILRDKYIISVQVQDEKIFSQPLDNYIGILDN